MRNFTLIYLIFLVPNIYAQEKKTKLIDVLNPYLLANEYKDLYRDLKRTYKDLAFKDTLEIEFTLNSSYKLQDFKINKSGNFDKIKINIEQKDWVFDNKQDSLTDSMKKRYELTTIRKGIIRVFKKRNCIYILSNIQKVNIRMYDVKNYYFYKCISIKSETPIKPLNYWCFQQYIEDSIKFNIISANRYMHINKDNRIKLTVPTRLFRFSSKLYLHMGKNVLIELSKNQNYVYLPQNSKIDFWAINCNSGKMIIKTIDLNKELIINDKYMKVNYFELAKMINK
jgi:hypothetical protein